MRQIAREVGVSDARVVQILAAARSRPSLEEVEAQVAAELRTLLEVRDAATARIAALRSALRRIEEERETRRIDEILGLA